MTDQRDYTARIRAKGLDATGVTEQVARKLYAHRGGHYMAIVEIAVDTTHDHADGHHGVDLILTQVEPALDDRLDSHLRGLTRALHAQRRLHDEDDQPQLDGVGDTVLSVGEVLAQGQGVLPEPPDDDWEYPTGEGQPGDHVSQNAVDA